MFFKRRRTPHTPYTCKPTPNNLIDEYSFEVKVTQSSHVLFDTEELLSILNLADSWFTVGSRLVQGDK